MGYRYVVFGAGMQGIATAYDLVRHCKADEVVLVEPNPAQCAYAREQFRRLLGTGAPLWVLPAVDDIVLRSADVVLSCAPHTANVEITRRAIQAGVAYWDLGGNTDVVEAQAKLCQVMNARSPVVPDCGVSPGLSNIFATHLALDGYDEIYVHCGGNPLWCPSEKENPLFYKLVFSPEGLASEYAGTAMTIHKGVLVPVQALSNIHGFNGEFESAPTANNSPRTAQHLLLCGVQEYAYRTLRYHGHFKKIWDLKLHMNESRSSLRLRAMPELQFDRQKDEDRLTLSVEGMRKTYGVGWQAKRHMTYQYDVPYNKNLQLTAMELMTSWGITTVAYYMASNKGRPSGFSMPEQFAKDAEWFFFEINMRLKHTMSL